MPKRKRTSPASQPSLFVKPVPKMPEGYYSGDKPNPNLRAFVEQHLRERPYDPATDEYDVPAHAKPLLVANRRNPINDLHIYWSKKPYAAIREYIQHYTRSGDLVLDPFCGSGGTALAALMDGRKAIAIDRSPAATFITRNYCTPVAVAELDVANKQLKALVQTELDWLYGTCCERCGGKAITSYTVYSQTFECTRCVQKVLLADCVLVSLQLHGGEEKTVSVCPNCYKRGFHETISTTGEHFGFQPVAVSYLCLNGCIPQRGQRRHNDEDARKRSFFAKHDLARIAEIELNPVPYWHPDAALSKHIPYRMLHKKDFRPSDAARLTDLFTKRNLWALAAILNSIHVVSVCRNELRFAFSGALFNATKMYQQRAAGGGPQKGTYYIPPIFREVMVGTLFEQKLGNLVRAAEFRDDFPASPSVQISTQSATNLKGIPDDSVDYIFTDPPYADKIQYGELNYLWEAWLNLDTQWHDDEIIISEIRGKTEQKWADMMRLAMAECFRVLKPGRWLSLCYHGAEQTWAIVQDIMSDVGFRADDNDDVVFIDTGQKTYNQLTADQVNRRDLVINFRKPKPGERRAKVTFTGDEDATTFAEKARAVIREHLSANPGATKDRVYDEVVSRLVRAGQMQAHNFDELLAQVAEPVREPVKQDLFTNRPPDLFGTHEVVRWYLREGEAGAEASQKALEKAAAEKLEAFVRRTAAEALRQSQARSAELRRRQIELEEQVKAAELDPAQRVAGARRELREAEQQLERLHAEQAELAQNALHYSPILEHYLLLSPKPRVTLTELLEDYFFQTEAGHWRPPADDDEREAKARRRDQAAHRHIRRLARLIAAGAPIPPDLQPDAPTLAEWIRYCKRSELYEEGKLLFEKGGLNLAALPEEAQVEVEEDYQVCVRRLAQSRADH